MTFITVIGKRWKRAVGASLTIALLSAVAVVGFTLLGSEVLAAWKTPESASQALSSGGAFEGLLNFNAPAETVARIAVKTEEAENGIQKASNGALLVKNWKSTQENLGEMVNQVQGLQKTNPLDIYKEGFQLLAVTGLLNKLLPNSPIINFVNTFSLAWLTTANGFLVHFYHMPPIPIPSPFF